MTSLFDIPEESLNKSTQLLREEFLARGWSVFVPYVGSSHMFIERPQQSTVHCFASIPPSTSYASGHLANDKFATHQLLAKIKVRQPNSVIVDTKDYAAAQDLMQSVAAVVVKPVDAGHGNGITTNVTTSQALQDAIVYAIQNNTFAQKAIVQEQFVCQDPIDIRILCIDNKFIGAIHRIPARVKGDGEHTLSELIDIENNSGKRGKPYFSPLAFIDQKRALEYLGHKSTDIPPAGQECIVMGVANYGAGGEIHDVTDIIPSWMVNQAELIAATMKLAVCGVDFMVDGLPDAGDVPDVRPAVVLEVNKAPSLAIHDMPTTGQPRGATKTYVDYLARLP